MGDTWHELRQFFLEDHSKLTRGYRDILKALRAGRDEDAARLADEIDLLAGPHIEFEEQFLYPLVAEQRGKAYADRLYREHAEMAAGLHTVRRLSVSGPPTPLTDSERQKLTEQMETGLEHATTCGTLLSYLALQPEAVQRDLLSHIQRLRATPRRWTEQG